MEMLLGSELLVTMMTWLVTYVIHSSVLLGVAWATVRFLPIHSALSRDVIWKAAAFGGFLTTALVLSNLLPSGLGNVLSDRPNIETPSLVSAEIASSGNLSRHAHSTPLSSTGPVVHRGQQVTSNAPNTFPFSGGLPFNYGLVLLGLWSVGAAVSTTRLLVLRTRFLDEIGPRVPIANTELRRELDLLKLSSGFTDDVQLTESYQLRSAVVLGRAEICLPSRIWSELSDDEQRSMLAHEFAHVLRRDPLWLQLFNALCGVFFLQPLNFVARTHYREAAEHACDQWVVQTTGLGTALASCLVKVAQWIRGTYQPTPYMGIGGSPLRQRIERLLDEMEDASTPWMIIPTLATVLLVAAFAPAVEVDRRDQSDAGNAQTALLELALTESLRDTLHVSLAPGLRYDLDQLSGDRLVVTGNGEIVIDYAAPSVLEVSNPGYIQFEGTNDRHTHRVRFNREDSKNLEALYWLDGQKSTMKSSANEWLAVSIKQFAESVLRNRDTRAWAHGDMREASKSEDNARRRAIESEYSKLAAQLQQNESQLQAVREMERSVLAERLQSAQNLAQSAQLQHQKSYANQLAALQNSQIDLEKSQTEMRLQAEQRYLELAKHLKNDWNGSSDELRLELDKARQKSLYDARSAYSERLADLEANVELNRHLTSEGRNLITSSASRYNQAVRDLRSEIDALRIQSASQGGEQVRLRKEELRDMIHSLETSINSLKRELDSVESEER